MRLMLTIATLAAVAAISFGALAVRATPGQANALGDGDGDSRSGVGGVLSYRAEAVRPASGHRSALQVVFTRSHGGAQAKPLRLLEATHRRVLWALATFRLGNGKIVAERFRWSRGQGWRDLGATRAACPAVPPEVRSAWRLTAC